MAFNLPRIPNWVKTGVSFIASLPLAVFTSIITTQVNKAFPEKFLNLINKPAPVPLWILVVFLLITLLPLLWTARHYHKAHQIVIKLNELDDSLLLLLPELDVNSNIHESLKRLLEQFIEKTHNIMPLLDDCGIAIYAPDPSNPEFLTTWCQSQSPNEYGNKVRFYIGQDPNQHRGCAGCTFVDGKRRIVHLSRINKMWQADDPQYIFSKDRNRRILDYMTLITIPIIGRTDSLGVLCLYSKDVTTFDSKAIQELLFVIANRLATVMLVARNYQLQHSTTN
ncbi:MAG: hypothetical protein RMY62_001525 [Nostoc sp. ZfuVER08]|jgi:hypothetical protein|uniref:GAF domain-containing protein n=1 Tax=Nostoc punctiforme FACHB-252 TaxID=1357509 RepID=A0ABR8H5C7_NOSPU|nr:hypothetical protein [Nostoc punctiforme]MBD2610719.1 hypothetical protein [Nostoc punctiforme FACHB-252]MBL1198494.1 hypothetical protein [Nostoc sp. GBBB01]MDZ8014792.1 hypothetical protein [Nostoc sp. ZfuVER08]